MAEDFSSYKTKSLKSSGSGEIEQGTAVGPMILSIFGDLVGSVLTRDPLFSLKRQRLQEGLEEAKYENKMANFKKKMLETEMQWKQTQIQKEMKKLMQPELTLQDVIGQETEEVPAPLPGEGKGMFPLGATVQQPTGKPTINWGKLSQLPIEHAEKLGPILGAVQKAQKPEEEKVGETVSNFESIMYGKPVPELRGTPEYQKKYSEYKELGKQEVRGWDTAEQAVREGQRSMQLAGLKPDEYGVVVQPQPNGKYSFSIQPNIAFRIPPYTPAPGMGPDWSVNRRTGKWEWKGEGAEPKGDKRMLSLAYQGDQTSLRQLESQRSKVMAFEQAAIQNAKQVYSLSKQIDVSRIPVLNKLILKGQTRVLGNEIESNYLLAWRTFINEYARVATTVSGGGITSDTARREMENAIQASGTPEQIQANIRQAILEMEHRRYGYDVETHNILSKWGTPKFAPQLPTEEDIYNIVGGYAPNVVPGAIMSEKDARKALSDKGIVGKDQDNWIKKYKDAGKVK